MKHQMVAWIGDCDLPDAVDGWLEVKHWKIYLDEEFALHQMNYGGDGELFSEDTRIDIKNGVYGPKAYTDEITLEEVSA